MEFLLKMTKDLKMLEEGFVMYRQLSVFFQKHSQLISRTNPRLHWNIDETSSQCTRRYKVLVNEGTRFFLTSIEKDYNHVQSINQSI